MNLLATLLALTLSAASSGAEIPAACTAALRRALDVRAVWTMERRIGKDGRALVSSGQVTCVAGSGIVWRVTVPFESSVAMTTNAMIFADEEGVRTKALDELPHYAAIRERTDAFVAGDARAFDGLFALSAVTFPPDGWRLTLRPEVSAMERLFTRIELTGATLPTNAVLMTADGGRSVIRFQEMSDGR